MPNAGGEILNCPFHRFLFFICVVTMLVISRSSVAQQSPESQPATSGVSGGAAAGRGARRPPPPPYSADLVFVTTQTLADGTTITRRSLLKKYRDSEGRTREEDFRNRPGDLVDIPINVIIVDPVAGVSYHLNPYAHQAYKTEMRPHASSLPAQTISVPANRPTAPLQPTVEGPGVQATALSNPNRVPKPPPPAMERVDLGTQDFEGVTARGSLTTFTVSAGAEGNDRPIQYTQENWYSDELRAQVLHITKDPRVGEIVTRLTNINLSEPPAELFQVPSDYTIVETQTVVSPPANKE